MSESPYKALSDMLASAKPFTFSDAFLSGSVCAVCGKRHRDGSKPAIAHDFGNQPHQVQLRLPRFTGPTIAMRRNVP